MISKIKTAFINWRCKRLYKKALKIKASIKEKEDAVYAYVAIGNMIAKIQRINKSGLDRQAQK